MSIITLDVNVKQWRDKVYGNNYQSARIVVDYGMKTEKTMYVPFQYGDLVDCNRISELLNKNGMIDKNDPYISLATYCRESGIIYRHNIQKDCLQKEVKAFGKE